MAFEMLDSNVLSDQLSKGAADFSKVLASMSVALDVEISKAMRKGVLDLFRAIIKRSPVDTGAYRASHGIANMEPAGDEEIYKGKKGEVIPITVALSKLAKWTWRLGDGDIFIFNNLPYAERIENGWSRVKAPAGVYRVSLAELTQHFIKEMSKVPGVVPSGGGGEL